MMGRRLLIITLALVVLSAFWGVWNIYRKNKEAAALRVEAEAQLADLKDRQTRLAGDYEKLKTERGLEEALRQQYAVGAAGEQLIVIVEPDKPQPVQATSSVMQWLKDALTHW